MSKYITEEETEKNIEIIFNNPTECDYNLQWYNISEVCLDIEIVKAIHNYIIENNIDESSRGGIDESSRGGVDESDSDGYKKSVIEKAKKFTNCTSESCVIQNKNIRKYLQSKYTNASVDDILDMYFKPESPEGEFGLLSNINIDENLDRLAEKYADRKFYHMDFQMSDFNKFNTELNRINLADLFLKKGYKTFGVVLNTDKTCNTCKGIHWFCIFSECFDDNTISLECFDSSGKPPSKSVKEWMYNTKHQLSKDTGLEITTYYSIGKEFQDDDHSCGVYSLAYIWLRLERVNPNWFTVSNFNDDMMHKLRKNLFRYD